MLNGHEWSRTFLDKPGDLGHSGADNRLFLEIDTPKIPNLSCAIIKQVHGAYQ